MKTAAGIQAGLFQTCAGLIGSHFQIYKEESAFETGQ
jgi:hypothetical protein